MAGSAVLLFTGLGGSTVGAGAGGEHPEPQAEAPAESILRSEVFSLVPQPDIRGSREVTVRETAPKPVRVNGRVQPRPVDVPAKASGRYSVVSGGAKATGRGPIRRYLVEVEEGLPFDGQEFAAEVHRILNDRRGWGQAGRTRFVRVDRGEVTFRVSLSSPQLTDKRCAPLRTFGKVSCFARGRAVINAVRWGTGSPTYGRDIAAYREYLVSHEVGHGLGHGHVSCPAPRALAPVMVQQTKSLEGCRPNPWPHP
jgi:hypothetical protein